MLKTLFKSTTVTLFSLYSAFLWWIGYEIGRIPDKNELVLEREKIIYPFLLGLIPLAAAALNYFINTQIEEQSKTIIEEKEKECENKVKSYAINHLRTLGLVEIELRKSNEPVATECLLKVNSFKEIFKNYVNNYEVSQEIVKWLDNRKEREKLLEKIVAETLRKNNISAMSSVSRAFSQDIGRCVNWLRDSIDVLDKRRVYPPEMTTALSKIGNNFKPYKDALTAIKLDDELQQRSGNTGIIEHYLDELIKELMKS
ncbi:hypothetical protein [Trichocoleus sp. DQ-U1]|uniref:hypothetical protein n=1 Tax=Trichocoleus sp. DQ-U1 TaxID=2933926 RepID=UPI003298D81E